MSDTPRLPGLTLAEADQLVNTAHAVAAERGFAPLAVAVLDVTGEVIALKRADGGTPVTSRVAVAKARTALRMLKPSGEVTLPGEVVGPLQHVYGGDFVARAGGILVTDGDVVVGAIGASGAQSAQDEEAVRAAVEQLQPHA
ncbi:MULTISPECIES: heme-binding protein [unclassified Amycolatopsis]|uniref:GlcG/HbpS family heme-binding protein n=1 Tax=unclassified Amycolatopsis TaxID=2618356 RepID=UPI0021021AEA|nr:heme-binding protein [Amycolatopsis sp. DSM 110486]